MWVRLVSLPLLLLATSLVLPAQQTWRARLEDRLALFGHRNWIVIADSAYPMQTNFGIETIYSTESQLETVRHVMALLARQTHVRPVVFLDQELRFVPEEDAPGIGAYRQLLDASFEKFSNRGLTAATLPHDEIVDRLDEASRTFNVLVIKTSSTLPYTSVFIQLSAAYWSDEAEKRLRQHVPPR